ncbi:hypothetical protein PLICRDRAFT_177348 [Plicaturopsis crispa FD-325 SS-3]|nr:hypothetical protein PLICRDRAFT_177348 [Plicaturopsis crispa FD-325 SS-3]
MEMLLKIFACIPNLKSLIAAQSVNRTWRRLVPLAELDPHRRALLELYIEAVNSPGFLATRRDMVHGVAPFDRQAWLDGVCRGKDASSMTGIDLLLYPNGRAPMVLPEEFRMWVEYNQEEPVARRRAWWRNDQEACILPWLYDPEHGRTDYNPMPMGLCDFELYAEKHAPESGDVSWKGSRLHVSTLLMWKRQRRTQGQYVPYPDSDTACMVVEICGVTDSEGRDIPSEFVRPMEEGLLGTVHMFADDNLYGSLATHDEKGPICLEKPRRWIDVLREELKRLDRCFDAGPMSEGYKKRFRDAAAGKGRADGKLWSHNEEREEFWSDVEEFWSEDEDGRRRRPQRHIRRDERRTFLFRM